MIFRRVFIWVCVASINKSNGLRPKYNLGFVLLDWAYGRVQAYKYFDDSIPSGFLEINIMPLFRCHNCHHFH